MIMTSVVIFLLIFVAAIFVAVIAVAATCFKRLPRCSGKKSSIKGLQSSSSLMQYTADESVWPALKEHGRKHGVVLQMTYPSVDKLMFEAPLSGTVKTWLEQSGMKVSSVMSGDKLRHSKQLVITIGSFWPENVPLPPYYLGLFSENSARDTAKMGILAQRRSKDDMLSLPPLFVTFSYEVQRVAAQSGGKVAQASWLWFPSDDHTGLASSAPLIPRQVPVRCDAKDVRIVIWCGVNERRLSVLKSLRAAGHTNVTLKVGQPADIVGWLRQPNTVLLNIHAYSDSGHLEVSRLTHPCVRGLCVISEVSNDVKLEELCIKRGLLHSVWDGSPNTLTWSVNAAITRHKKVDETSWANRWAPSVPKWW